MYLYALKAQPVVMTSVWYHYGHNHNDDENVTSLIRHILPLKCSSVCDSNVKISWRTFYFFATLHGVGNIRLAWMRWTVISRHLTTMKIKTFPCQFTFWSHFDDFFKHFVHILFTVWSHFGHVLFNLKSVLCFQMYIYT